MILEKSSLAGSNAKIMSVGGPLRVGGPVRGLGEFEQPLGVLGGLSDGHDG